MDARVLLLLTALVAFLLYLEQTLAHCCANSNDQCHDNGMKEPPLPYIDNYCCGCHCNTTAANAGLPGVACTDAGQPRCLLDLSCHSGAMFQYSTISCMQLKWQNDFRAIAELPRLLSFNWTKTVCENQNSCCGINCCCREQCSSLFC